MNQSELESNAREQVTIGFGFASQWLRKWREFCQLITGTVKENQSKHELHCEPLLFSEHFSKAPKTISTAREKDNLRNVCIASKGNNFMTGKDFNRKGVDARWKI